MEHQRVADDIAIEAEHDLFGLENSNLDLEPLADAEDHDDEFDLFSGASSVASGSDHAMFGDLFDVVPDHAPDASSTIDPPVASGPRPEQPAGSRSPSPPQSLAAGSVARRAAAQLVGSVAEPWGDRSQYLIRFRPPDSQNPSARWIGTCPYHKKSQKTGCQKSMSIETNDGVVSEASKAETLLRMKWWLCQSSAYDRQQWHNLFHPAYCECPPLAIVEAVKHDPVPDIVKTDTMLDDEEFEAAAATARRARGSLQINVVAVGTFISFGGIVLALGRPQPQAKPRGPGRLG